MIKPRLRLAGLGLLVLLQCSAAGATPGNLYETLATIAAEEGVEGAAWVVLKDAEVADIGTLGLASRATGKPVTLQTPFAVGSLSKLVTSLLAMDLVQEGTLNLSTPVAGFFERPPFINPWQENHPVRLVHLLEHTAGLPGSSYRDYGYTGPDIEPAEYAAFLADRPAALRWQPGLHFSYSNAGHTLAARVLEKASGQAFDELITQRIFQPLGMSSASFLTSIGPRLGQSYLASGEPAQRWPMAFRPSGAMSADITDLAKLARVLILASQGEDNPLNLAPEIVQRMLAGQTALPARHGYELTYGLGTFGFLVADRLFYGHWGKTEGFQTSLGFQPGSGDGFVIVSNTVSGAAMQRFREALVASLPAQSPLPPPAAAVPEAAQAVPPGVYWPFTHDMVVRSWLFGLIQSVRVQPAEEHLQLCSPWLASLPCRELVAVGAGAFRDPAFPLTSHLFFSHDGRDYLFGDGQETFIRMSEAEALGLVGLLWLAAFGLPVGLLICPWLAIRARRSTGAWGAMTLGPTLAFVGTALLVAKLVLFAKSGIFAPLGTVSSLGTPGLRSITLLLLSLAWPALALVSAGLLVKSWRAQGRFSRWAHLLVVTALLAVAVALVTVDWLPLVLWQ